MVGIRLGERIADSYARELTKVTIVGPEGSNTVFEYERDQMSIPDQIARDNHP
jgi:hypothetical protein